MLKCSLEGDLLESWGGVRIGTWGQGFTGKHAHFIEREFRAGVEAGEGGGREGEGVGVAFLARGHWGVELGRELVNVLDVDVMGRGWGQRRGSGGFIRGQLGPEGCQRACMGSLVEKGGMERGAGLQK